MSEDKLIRIYVHPKDREEFKEKCKLIYGDSMKEVIIVLCKSFLYFPTESSTQYLRARIDQDSRGTGTYKMRLSHQRIELLKELAEKLNTSISQLIRVFMKISLETLTLQDYEENKKNIKELLTEEDKIIRVEIRIQDKEICEEIYKQVLLKNPYKDEVPQLMQKFVTEGFQQFLEIKLKKIKQSKVFPLNVK